MADLSKLAALEGVIALAEDARAKAYAARDAMVSELRQEGFSQRETAAMLGISFQRVSQIEKAAWGQPVPMTPAERLQVARDAYASAVYAQTLRCEREAMGYREETRAYFGDPNVAQADVSEDRIKWAGWHVGVERETAEAS